MWCCDWSKENGWGTRRRDARDVSSQFRQLDDSSSDIVTYPDLLHVIPVGHDAVLDGILQCEDTSLGLGLVTDIGILLVHANHDLLGDKLSKSVRLCWIESLCSRICYHQGTYSRVLWAANNWGENGSWGIVTGKACFAHARSIINNERLDVFVGHFVYSQGVISWLSWYWCNFATGACTSTAFVEEGTNKIRSCKTDADGAREVYTHL